MYKRIGVGTGIKYLVIIGLSAISLFPIFVLITTSLKTQAQSFSIPPVWLFIPILENYVDVLFQEKFLRYLSNSISVVLISTILTLIAGALAAYSLSRFRFIGRGVFSVATLILRMIAPAVLVVPLFVLWCKFGLINTKTGLMITYTGLNLPFAIWVLRSFISEIPVELDEAALMDGCSEIGIFFRIIFPLIIPGIAAVSIFVFRIAWNEFLLALVLTNRFTRTLPVATSLYLTDHGIQWSKLTAMGTLIALPALLFTFLAARRLIKGLTAGAVKG